MSTYKSEQEGYQFKRTGGDAKQSKADNYKGEQESYSFVKRAGGGPVAPVPLSAVPNAARDDANTPQMKRGGMMTHRKEHHRRRV